MGGRRVFGPQKGADPATVAALEQRLDRRGPANWTRPPDGRSAREPGAGAAGGIGAALLALGGRCESGAAIIAEHTRLADDIAAADLVITGEGRFDDQSLHGKVVGALAERRGRGRVPVVGAGRSGRSGRRGTAVSGHPGGATRSPTTPVRCGWPWPMPPTS